MVTHQSTPIQIQIWPTEHRRMGEGKGDIKRDTGATKEGTSSRSNIVITQNNTLTQELQKLIMKVALAGMYKQNSAGNYPSISPTTPINSYQHQFNVNCLLANICLQYITRSIYLINESKGIKWLCLQQIPHQKTINKIDHQLITRDSTAKGKHFHPYFYFWKD